MLPGGIGGLLILIGAVWFLQGIGVIPGSFMTGSAFWALVGALSFLAGLVLLVVAGLRRRRQPRGSPPRDRS